MTDKDPQANRDWDREMREVDRLLAKLPYADPKPGTGAEPTLKKPVPGVEVARAGAGPSWLGTWTRVALGLLVGVGMTQWPYTHGCGIRLAGYLVGVVAVLAAGIWSSLSSWRRRLGVAHVLAQLLIIWGLVLGARELLPRVGYARAPAAWFCP